MMCTQNLFSNKKYLKDIVEKIFVKYTCYEGRIEILGT